MREQPAEALLPGPQPALSAFDREREAEQPRGHRVVDGPGDHSHAHDEAVAQAGARAQMEDLRRTQEGKRQRTDVEHDLVHGRAPSTPVDDGLRAGERERRPRTEESCSRKRTDGGHRDRAVVQPERQRLTGADQDGDRQQADDVRRGAEYESEHAGGDSDRADEADEQCDPAREREEARTVRRPGMRRLTPLLGAGRTLTRRGLRLALGHRDQTRRPLAAQQQRLGARAEDAVATLKLGSVNSQVGVVNELARIAAVVREAGDADRDRHPDRLARGLDLDRPRRDCAPDAFGDLERLVVRRLREEDRELLSPEARGQVVVAEL